MSKKFITRSIIAIGLLINISNVNAEPAKEQVPQQQVQQQAPQQTPKQEEIATSKAKKVKKKIVKPVEQEEETQTKTETKVIKKNTVAILRDKNSGLFQIMTKQQGVIKNQEDELSILHEKIIETEKAITVKDTEIMQLKEENKALSYIETILKFMKDKTSTFVPSVPTSAPVLSEPVIPAPVKNTQTSGTSEISAKTPPPTSIVPIPPITQPAQSQDATVKPIQNDQSSIPEAIEKELSMIYTPIAKAAYKTKQIAISQNGDYTVMAIPDIDGGCNVTTKTFNKDTVIKKSSLNACE